MVDVVICCVSGDQSAGRRLADAVAGAGYEPWWNDGSSPDVEASDEVLGRIAAAKAALVIWSKASRASKPLRAEARLARSQRKLIEISIDGSKPMPPFDPEQLISLSGWRGQDGHPGWRSIVRELERLCGPVKAPTPEVAAPSRSRRRGLMAGLAVLLIMSGLAAAAIVWRESGPRPDPEVEAASPTQRPVPSAVVAPRPVPAPPVLAAPPPEPELPAPGEDETRVQDTAPAELSPPPAKTDRQRVQERSKAAEPQAKARQKQPAEGSRVKYKYSRNMRVFCAGAGRSTRECRTFRRNSGNGASERRRSEPPPQRLRGPPS